MGTGNHTSSAFAVRAALFHDCSAFWGAPGAPKSRKVSPRVSQRRPGGAQNPEREIDQDDRANDQENPEREVRALRAEPGHGLDVGKHIRMTINGWKTG